MLIGRWAAFCVAAVELLVVGAGCANSPGSQSSAGSAATNSEATTTMASPAFSCQEANSQLNGDPYAPECMSFSGGNGGATSRGVTGSTITISYRLTTEANSQYALTPGNAAATETTIRALASYFNQRFQFYGRHLSVAFLDGRGTLEETGVESAAAESDAAKVARQLDAFADLSAFTEPYADALTGQKVLALGEIGLPESWFRAHDPYAWSAEPAGLTCPPNQSPFGTTFGYFAFKTQDPDAEPVTPVEILYAQMDQLAIGIALAGPDLTPASFAAGLGRFPPHDGPHGEWAFSEYRHTPSTCPPSTASS